MLNLILEAHRYFNSVRIRTVGSMEPFCVREREAADSGAYDQNSVLIIYDNKTSFMKSNIKTNKNSACGLVLLLLAHWLDNKWIICFLQHYLPFKISCFPFSLFHIAFFLLLLSLPLPLSLSLQASQHPFCTAAVVQRWNSELTYECLLKFILPSYVRLGAELMKVTEYVDRKSVV